ncbi:uncharacterized protein LOC112560607 [Pomacea canaliculata]|uniref:uncharacterized protein LOC112560607 n=1 Tax=Pomacea canaliculata TaxID=400727 RepID=UPI000D733F18|nr:uncharacterized protein LOC112560607 [Pomacea canaliculata]XP_025088327.1 uncharacterized protein LOC112560607 [Pomacea canaliculata]
MTSLPELVLLVTCGAIMASGQHSEQPRHVTKPLVQYTTLTCNVPLGYREKNILSLEIFRRTESGYLRSLVNKARDQYFPELVLGDVPTLFNATGQVIEHDASSSFLNASFVLDDDTHGQYICMITFKYITGNKKETESLDIFIGEPSTIKENIISIGFSGYFTPAFREQWTWYLPHLPLQKLELKEDILQNSATKDSKPCWIICIQEGKPCDVHPDVLAHNLSYFYDSNKKEHIIKMDVCIINGSSCRSVKYTANVEIEKDLKLVEALVFLNSNTDPSKKVIGTESNIKENTTTHNGSFGMS